MLDMTGESRDPTLSNLYARHQEIEKENSEDIAEIHDDLTQLVCDFTSALSDRGERERETSSSPISQIETQVRRLEEGQAVISSFIGIFQQFHSLTSTILNVRDQNGKSGSSAHSSNSLKSLGGVEGRGDNKGKRASVTPLTTGNLLQHTARADTGARTETSERTDLGDAFTTEVECTNKKRRMSSEDQSVSRKNKDLTKPDDTRPNISGESAFPK